MDSYRQFIAKSRYARWLDKEQRRENWEETVTRSKDFFLNRHPDLKKEINKAYSMVLNHDIMGSMRVLMTAGKALDRDNVAGFNCSAIAINNIKAWDEAMYILMCGTGVGFSCERQYINDLPRIIPESNAVEELLERGVPDEIIATIDNSLLRELYNDFPRVNKGELSYLDINNNIIKVHDSKTGWASALRILIVECYNCNFEIKWDLSKVRPAGSRLMTFGGRASGPEPLNRLFTFVIEVFKNATGRKLNSIECHDLMCFIAEIVICGGVRRSALISLSNLSDQRMSKAKSGQWWIENSQRALANNSVAYTEKPDIGTFLSEWTNLYESKSGERGIFSRVASEKQAAKNGRRLFYPNFLTNPCSEIILRANQFCNLSEVIVRQEDTLETLKNKVKYATIIGTMQAKMVDFRYLSENWKENTEEEALLGVSLTGVMDHEVLAGNTTFEELEFWLDELKKVAIDTNKKYAPIVGVNVAAAITCNKPSGTVSQLTDSASGIHPRYAPYYIRTVRQDRKDPITQFLVDQGVPHELCHMKPDSTMIFSFPIKSPEISVFRDDRTAIEQLNHWLVYQRHWCEHKPSVTIYVKEHEWLEVGAWVYKHFDEVSGVSFLPHSEHSYAQAPYQECTKEEYENFPRVEIDWKKLDKYESTDNTTGVQTLACTNGVCEI